MKKSKGDCGYGDIRKNVRPKMLITGASGFMGSRIAEYYKDSYEILTPSHSQLEITDEQNVWDFFQRNKPDYVVHCAAVSDVGACEKEPERSRKINVTGSENIARAAGGIGAKCVMCSSDQVYSASTRQGPHSESEELEPGNEYGKQKLFAEQSCLEINPDCVMLRLSWMYDSVSKMPGEHSDFLRTLLKNLKEDRELFYPVNDIRGITDVNQAAAHMEQVFQLPGGVYNYGSSNTMNTFVTAEKLFRRLGYDTRKLHQNREAFADNPRDITMDMSRLEAFGIYFTDTVEGLYQAVMKMSEV